MGGGERDGRPCECDGGGLRRALHLWHRVGPHRAPILPSPPSQEGRVSDAAHRRLVQSAVEGGFNTLRLWGGGIFQYDAWYDACDELGVLVYHDMSE